MLRIKENMLSLLQKVYDDTYLACSTAVYYESQGNEDEALRCWRAALNKLRDEDTVRRALVRDISQSSTEKALVDSLRELELQCKERIDLLQALRLSRNDTAPPAYNESDASPAVETPVTSSPAQSWLGGGTVRPVTYTELSRPTLPRAASASSSLIASDTATIGAKVRHSEDGAAESIRSLHIGSSGSSGPSASKPSRSSSPEKHTLKTTLRNAKPSDKQARRPVFKSSDRPGASSAAAAAWSALGFKGRSSGKQPVGQFMPPPPPPLPQSSQDGSRDLPVSSQMQWDRHTRRLVGNGEHEIARGGSGSSQVDTPNHSRRRIQEPASPHYLEPQGGSGFGASSTSLTDDGTDFRRRSADSERQYRSNTAISRDAAPSPFALAAVRSNAPKQPRLAATTPQKPNRAVGQPSSSSPSTTAKRKIHRPPVGRRRESSKSIQESSSSQDEIKSSNSKLRSSNTRGLNAQLEAVEVDEESTSPSQVDDQESDSVMAWKKKKARILKKLPPGVDEQSAKQILNEVVVQGDHVRWSDIAGLEIAKNALRETVVYPFLRPDLFSGLREPARGMLLFGPPGTGKTMLARAVATESQSTFFSISASSLTSKYLGESEKLVRALFTLARVLAPSIIFVDEIDSLLSQRSGSGEHEATRRIKTEFLIQWSDLQRAAAGSTSPLQVGDPNRVLVLAATNLPWAIDEAARRRFVRRQYIPLPEAETRKVQFTTLLSQQKHSLSEAEIDQLVSQTDGFSGSDITALAKDAAMGPLRSLGEALLHMTMDEIRPIGLQDFTASLRSIRPSVSKEGLDEYDNWARQFGERGG